MRIRTTLILIAAALFASGCGILTRPGEPCSKTNAESCGITNNGNSAVMICTPQGEWVIYKECPENRFCYDDYGDSPYCDGTRDYYDATTVTDFGASHDHGYDPGYYTDYGIRTDHGTD